MIVAAVLTCPFKAYESHGGAPAVDKMRGVDRIYMNVEQDPSESGIFYDADHITGAEFSKPVDYDFWTVKGNWRQPRKGDQDQGYRLGRICTARNMTLDYALSQGASHVLFVDSDVEPQPDGLERLLALDKPLCGGLVPGRGAHSGFVYVFGIEKTEGDVVECHHGTMGYALIRREVFEVLRFRWGPAQKERATWLSEDPAYANDAYLMGYGRWWIDMRAAAKHHDNPAHPLVAQEAATF